MRKGAVLDVARFTYLKTGFLNIINGEKVLKAVAYIRVSQEGERPENQRLAIEGWAKRNGVVVVGFFIDEAVSGAVPPRQRSQYSAMLRFCESNNIKTIVFYDVSRLGRNLEETLYELKRLLEEGYNVYFVYPEFLNQMNDPMFKKFVVSMLAWFAELYRYDIVQRTKAGLERAKREGKRIGRPRKEVDIGKVLELRRKGVSFKDIARLMSVSYSTLKRRLKESGYA